MRITPTMMMNDYQNTLESNLGRLNQESEKVSTERKFSRASEDPVDALKTLRTYRELAGTDQYQESAKETGDWVNDVGSALKTVDGILSSANSLLVASNSGTYNADDAKTHATSLDSYQDELMQTLNSSFNGQYVFGGDASGPAPFKIGTQDDLSGSKPDIDTSVTNFGTDAVVGKLLYNIPGTSQYVPVSAINNSTSGDPKTSVYKYSINNPAMKYSMPVDVGMGIKTDSSHSVVNGTAFDASTSALDFLCQNMTGTSSENIVDSLGNAADQLRNSTTPKLDDAMQMVSDTQNAELKSTVTVGEKSKMLGFLNSKLTTDNTNLTSRLSTIEDVDITSESTNFMMDQMVYNASLSISSTILQHSLIDFLK